MNDSDSELTNEEREALARLPREVALPPGLEDATVGALAERGLLRRETRRRRRSIEWGLAAAAAVALFAGGFLAGRDGGQAPAGELPRFVLLLYEGPEYRNTPPGQEQDRVREYTDWARERGAKGELEAGEKLREEPDVVIRADGSIGEEAPTPGVTRLAGFFMIRARDDR
ncbi:MAG TPA: hypothetical protein VGF31_11255, partial [Myxococcaceae bacterium]